MLFLTFELFSSSSSTKLTICRHVSINSSSEGLASDDEEFIDTRLQIVSFVDDEEYNTDVKNNIGEDESKEKVQTVCRQDSEVSDQTSSNRSSVSSEKVGGDLNIRQLNSAEFFISGTR